VHTFQFLQYDAYVSDTTFPAVYTHSDTVPNTLSYKTPACRPSPNEKIPISLTKTFAQNQKSIKSDIGQFQKMNPESPQKDETLTAMAPADNIDSPSQNKRNQEDAPAHIPPSPPKLQRTTSSESNTKNKKGMTTTTTTKITLEDALKPFKAIKPINLMGAAGPRLYIKTVANGLFHLLYVQELNETEAFSHPVIKKLFPNPKERIGEKTDFVRRTGIIAVAPRRTSKAMNVAISRKTSDNKTFKAMVYVSMLDSNTPSCKKNVLNTITYVSTKNKTENLFYKIPRRYLLTPLAYCLIPPSIYTRITSSSTKATP
jgi:hypothetical protein